MTESNGATDAIMKRLKEAADRAMSGGSPYDSFLAYGLTVEDAGTWCALWAQQLARDAKALGQNPRSEAFTYRLMLGALIVGVELGAEYGRQSLREPSTPSTP